MRAAIFRVMPATLGAAVLGMVLYGVGLAGNNDMLQIIGGTLTLPATAVFAVLLLAVVVGYAGVAAITAAAYCLAWLRRRTRR